MLPFLFQPVCGIIVLYFSVPSLTQSAAIKSTQNIPIALFGCAAAAFIASSFLLVPGELIKQRLQTGQYSSMMDGVRSIMKNDGLPGFYCGYAAVCFRDVPYTMLELGLYDNLKSAYCWWKNRGEKKGRRYEISQQDEILIGAITGGE